MNVHYSGKSQIWKDMQFPLRHTAVWPLAVFWVESFACPSDWIWLSFVRWSCVQCVCDKSLESFSSCSMSYTSLYPTEDSWGKTTWVHVTFSLGINRTFSTTQHSKHIHLWLRIELQIFVKWASLRWTNCLRRSLYLQGSSVKLVAWLVLYSGKARGSRLPISWHILFWHAQCWPVCLLTSLGTSCYFQVLRFGCQSSSASLCTKCKNFTISRNLSLLLHCQNLVWVKNFSIWPIDFDVRFLGSLLFDARNGKSLLVLVGFQAVLGLAMCWCFPWYCLIVISLWIGWSNRVLK